MQQGTSGSGTLPVGTACWEGEFSFRAGRAELAPATLTEQTPGSGLSGAEVIGESDPVSKRAGDRLLSGSFVVAGIGPLSGHRGGCRVVRPQAGRRGPPVHTVRSELVDGINRILRYIAGYAPPGDQ